MSRALSKAAICVAATILIFPATAPGGVFNLTAEGDGQAYTVVEVDTFKSGDTPGNTVGAVTPAAPWASISSSNGDGLWRERAHAAFFGSAVPGSSDLTFELGGADSTAAPELVTTVSGLAPGRYDVYAGYITRNDGNNDDAGVLADLGGPATTFHSHGTPNAVLAFNGSNVWDFTFSRLGTTPSGTTSFTVNSKGTADTSRNDLMAVAYRPAGAPPAGPLSVDIGDMRDFGGGPGGTQSGFVAFEGTESGGLEPVYRALPSALGTDGTVGVKLSNYTHFRDYAAITGGSFVAQNALLSDLVLRNSNGTLKLTLDDLLPGTYEITTYHHNTQFGGATFDMKLYDANGRNQPVVTGATVSSGTSPSSISIETFQFTAAGSSVLIDLLGGGGQHLTLNGFDLNLVEANPLRVQKTDVLALDFNDRGAGGAGNTQPGFQEFLITSTGSPTTQTFGSIDVTLSHSNGGTIEDRRRTAPSDNGSFTEQELLRDFVFAYGTSADDGVDVLFEGLTPRARYEVTIWAYDDANADRMSDWFAGGELAYDDYVFDGTDDNNYPIQSNGIYSFHFLADADAFGDLLIGGRAAGGSNPNVFLNAISLARVQLVPEPSTWALALLAFSALGVFARRRKRD